MLAQSMTGRFAQETELDAAIARSCWGCVPLVAGGDGARDAPSPEQVSPPDPSENFSLPASPVCDAKGADKPDEGEEEEEGDDFEEDDEDDEDEEFEGDDEFEDDDDEFFDGDDDDDEFGDDADDEDGEDEDF